MNRNWLIAFVLVIAAALLPAPSARAIQSTTKVNIVGTYVYTYIPGPLGNGGTIGFGITKLTNPSTTHTTGTLRLDFWAFPTQYNGTAISGYKMASYQIGGSTNGQLAPGQSFTNLEASASITSTPAAGSYYISVLISEYEPGVCSTSTDGFCTVNYENFPSLFTRGTSITDTATTTTTSGGTTTGGGTTGGTTGGGSTTTTALHEGLIFSSAQTASQSLLRFVNTGSTAGTVTVKLSDYSTGQQLVQWTSDSIPAGAAPQIPISTIEAAATTSFTKPSYYAITVTPSITGYMQHVLYRAADGTLTNLSACDGSLITNAQRLANVHSSAFDSAYPSTVGITNTGSAASTVTLGVYNAADGSKLGTYTTPSIPANGQLVMTMTSIMTAGNISGGSALHYVVKVESSFTGYLQHLVNNIKAGVTTDMTAACSFTSLTASTATTVHEGLIFSSAQSTSLSLLRLFNTGSTAGTVTVNLSDYSTGQQLAQWTSDSIPAGASPQIAISTIEAAATQPYTKPAYYEATVTPSITGYMQHVLYRAADGTLTNLSACDGSLTTDSVELANVHASTFDSGYPSTIGIYNTGSAAASVTLGIYNAADGSKLGTYTSPAIQANGQLVMTMTSIATAANVSSSALHYVVKIESTFTGYLQHLVNNIKAGVITDMSAACKLTPANGSGGSSGGSTTTSFTLVTTTAGTGSGVVNANPNGQVLVTGTAVYAAYTQVTLTASANAYNNSVFTSWSGACTGTAVTCTITMDASKTVTANFDAPTTTGGGIAETWIGTFNVDVEPISSATCASVQLWNEKGSFTITAPAPGLVAVLKGYPILMIGGSASVVETIKTPPYNAAKACPYTPTSTAGPLAFTSVSAASLDNILIDTATSLFPSQIADAANNTYGHGLTLKVTSYTDTTISGTFYVGNDNQLEDGTFTMTKK